MGPYYKYSATMGDRTYFTSVVTTNGIDKRYFSNIESEIYFGHEEMTDLYQFEFGIDEKVLPIYGYNCYYASELVSGQRIVQGQFVVNYTDSMLIQSVLSSIEDSIYKEITAPEYLPGGDLHHAIYDKQFDIMIGYGYNYKDDGVRTYNATSQTIIGAKISGMHKVMDTTGQPILEVFTFVAKDFIEETIISASTGETAEEEKPKKSATSKVTYVWSDNNADNTDKLWENRKIVTDNPECLHFIHTLTCDRGRLKLHVREASNKAMTLKSFKIVINNPAQKEGDPAIPLPQIEMKKDNYFETKHSIVTTIPNDSIFKMDANIRKGKRRFKCDLEYVVKVGKNEYKISDEAIMVVI